MTEKSSRIPGFYNLSIEERLEQMRVHAGLSDDDLAVLRGDGGLTPEQAGHMVENVIGVHSLPLGIALNFVVNGREVLVPMALEEPSVVAGASFMARLARAGGGFIAHVSLPEMIGQMQVLDVADLPTARLLLLEKKQELLEEAGEIDQVLKNLGGGPRDLEIRLFKDSPIGPFLVIHLIYDVRDAMGANAVNTAVERLAPRVETITGGRVHLRILSNLSDRRVARARCTIPLTELAFDGYGPDEVRDGILAAWAFASVDPYRAATHNKGIMNAVDPILIATGNDWRAVEAGVHAYASRGGIYTSLSTWGKSSSGDLVGTLEMPLAVGIVGGATRVHPSAKVAIKILGVKSASELAEVIVSLGLAQNLAALRALGTEGIQRGHMTLHARQVAVAAGAEGDIITRLAQKLIEEENIRIDRAEEILRDWDNKEIG
jgi:hydroxymethylglutaryl-CoA reductase